MLIKVCGLKEKGNVEELLSKGSPDLLGMIFYEKSGRYIGNKPLQIDPYQGPSIPKVGVFVNESIQTIIEKQKAFGFEWVQLHGDEDLHYISELKKRLDNKIIKVVRVEEKIDFDKLRPFEALVDYFLFDTQTSQYGGSGKQFDWKVLEGYNLTTPFILSGGLDLDHAEDIVTIYTQHPKMAGVDINSKFEIEPGIKDPDKVSRFINIIREKTKADQL